MKNIEMYTDGACSGNPGKGGYAAILLFNDIEKIISGGENLTTNNRMELMAALMGLKGLKEKCSVSCYSDSAYLVNAFNNGWLNAWKRNDWLTSSNKPVLNVDLWKAIDELTSYHEVKFIKVKGHSTNEKNNRCDEIARNEISKL